MRCPLLLAAVGSPSVRRTQANRRARICHFRGDRGARRQRTSYTITTDGRAALEEWFGTEPAAPVVEIEGLLRIFLGDQATADDLRQSLEATAGQAGSFTPRAMRSSEDMLDTGGLFPQRLHLIEPMVGFLDDYDRLLFQWCEQTVTEIDGWPDTRDIGLTPQGRQRLERIFAQPYP